MKDTRILLAVILTSVFLIITGITYAYFSLVVSGNDVAQYVSGDGSASNPFVIK